jgi:hypothetical protein
VRKNVLLNPPKVPEMESKGHTSLKNAIAKIMREDAEAERQAAIQRWSQRLQDQKLQSFFSDLQQILNGPGAQTEKAQLLIQKVEEISDWLSNEDYGAGDDDDDEDESESNKDEHEPEQVDTKPSLSNFRKGDFPY